MKKTSVLFAVMLAVSVNSKADEGMWTLYNLPPQVYNAMQGYGFQMSYDDFYFLFFEYPQINSSDNLFSSYPYLLIYLVIY